MLIHGSNNLNQKRKNQNPTKNPIQGPLLFGGALFLLLGVYVGGFVGMVVLGCGKQVLGVRAAKTSIERV